MQGLLAGLLVLSVTYFGGKGLLQRFFFRTGYVYAEETERAEELQEYVTQNKLSASDYKMLKKWGTERNIDDFTISRGKWLLFDISYNGKIMYGSREIPNLTWRMYHRISFKDGTADVYIYEGTADKYFNILMVFSVVLGVAVCIGIVVSGMYENVKYIQCLMKEVNIISRGNLQGNVTVQGTDEIAQLASGLEHMRQTLVKKEQIEYDLKSAQEKLVLGMSHDLRTPLTGLMAYLEILKKQQKEGKLKGWGASVFFTKEIYCRKRTSKFGIITNTMLFYLLVSVGISLFCVRIMEVSGFLVPGCILFFVLFFRNMGNPIAQETARNWLFLVPENPYKKVFFGVLAGTSLCAMDLLPALVVSALLLHEKPGIMLLWYLTYLVADFMFSEVGLLLEALVPASAMDTVKSMIQILLRCIILVIVAVFLAIGYFFGGIAGALVFTCAASAGIGGAISLIYPWMLHQGR